MTGSIERVIRALNSVDARYLIVGGVAVVLHGHLRTTADLDLVIQLEAGNARRALDALGSLGYRARAPVPLSDFADATKRHQWVEAKGLTVFSLWHPSDPALEVDLFVEEPFEFDDAYRRALSVQLDTTTATVVSLEDLIALKERAGRPADLSDIEALRAIAEAGTEAS
jgi:predicted nucleotidyltransferase